MALWAGDSSQLSVYAWALPQAGLLADKLTTNAEMHVVAHAVYHMACSLLVWWSFDVSREIPASRQL